MILHLCFSEAVKTEVGRGPREENPVKNGVTSGKQSSLHCLKC